MNRVLYFSILWIVLFITLSANTNISVFGHTFSGDESASFLTKVEMIKIESQLAQEQLSSNVTSAKEHVEHTTEHLTANDTKEISERNPRLATELNNSLTDFSNTFESESPSQSEVKDKVGNISDILSEVVSVRIDKEQLDNVTVKALVLNDLVGESLEHYSSALSMEKNGHEKNMTSTTNSTENKNNETTNVVDDADYQSAQAAVSRAIDIYKEIKPNSNTNSTELEDSLSSVKEKIDSKSPLDEIDKIVDEKITPLLNDVFKLSLAEEEGEAHGEEAKDHGEEESHASSENETHEADTDG